MERLFGFVLAMIVLTVLLGFVLAHAAMVLVMLVGVGLLGRHLRKHGV